MSKYLCQDCKSNNNGWCTVRKCNGLKKLNITSCNTYSGNIETRGKRFDSKILDDSGEYKNEAYKVLGKREMLWRIQMQVVAIDKDDSNYEEKYKALIDCIKSIGIHLNFEERLWKVDDIIDSIIDSDILKDSKYINDNLL